MSDTPAAPTTPMERLADDVRWGFPKSDYARGFNDGIDALIARLAEARSTPAEALLRRWRDASLGGDLSELVDLTNETTDFLGDGNA